MPKGLNSWKATSTIVAFASSAAFFIASVTNSRLLRVLELQSRISSNRWVPNACNLFSSYSARRKLPGLPPGSASTASRSRGRAVTVYALSVLTSDGADSSIKLIVIYQNHRAVSIKNIIEAHFFSRTPLATARRSGERRQRGKFCSPRTLNPARSGIEGRPNVSQEKISCFMTLLRHRERHKSARESLAGPTRSACDD